MFMGRAKTINRDDYVEMSGPQLRKFCCRIIMSARYREDLTEVREVLEHLIDRHTPKPRADRRDNNQRGNGQRENQNRNANTGRPA